MTFQIGDRVRVIPTTTAYLTDYAQDLGTIQDLSSQGAVLQVVFDSDPDFTAYVYPHEVELAAPRPLVLSPQVTRVTTADRARFSADCVAPYLGYRTSLDRHGIYHGLGQAIWQASIWRNGLTDAPPAATVGGIGQYDVRVSAGLV